MKNADYYVKSLSLLPHPEGGFYREIFRSKEQVTQAALPERYKGDRNFLTSIYFLLRSEDISAFHRIKSDELWYYHAGSMVEIYLLNEKGLETVKLGPDIENGEVFQAIVPKETWFAAKVKEQNTFTLVSCAVAPGFDFADFELAKKDELLKLFPEEKEIVERMSIKQDSF
mgnify:CR=1 FL=1